MSEQFESRLENPESLDDLLQEAMDRCGLGGVAGYKLVDVGFEDYNVIVTNDLGEKYFVKVLAKTRTRDEMRRYASVIEAALMAGVNHPLIHRDQDGNILITANDMSMIVMDAIDGHTFYDTGTVPDETQLHSIIQQAVKISRISLVPAYEYDSWAVPNIRDMYEKIQDNIEADARPLIDEAVRRYEALPVDDLPRCFVHGDLTKANIVVGNDGRVYPIDFSVSNIYPRIQELVVMATSLMFDEVKPVPIQDCLTKLADLYVEYGGELTQLEHDSMLPYALAAFAMEYLGSLNEQIHNGDSEEIRHWKQLGINGLEEALK